MASPICPELPGEEQEKGEGGEMRSAGGGTEWCEQERGWGHSQSWEERCRNMTLRWARHTSSMGMVTFWEGWGGGRKEEEEV